MRSDRYGIWGATRWRRDADDRLIPMEDDIWPAWAICAARVVAIVGGWLAVFGLGYAAGWLLGLVIYGS